MARRSRPIHNINDPKAPELLTVEDAGPVLRIGRSLAYKLAAVYIASGGVEGLPVLRIGGVLRVPLKALRELIETGVVVQLCPAREQRSAASTTRRRRESVPAAQLTLLDS